MAAAVSLLDYGIWTQKHLNAFFEHELAVVAPWRRVKGKKAWLGWGCKRSGGRAAKNAARDGVACWRVEDGFLRSVGMGKGERPLSIVVDDVGIYYDSRSPSRLERLIPAELDAQQSARAARLVDLWRAARVSKYNHQTVAVPALPAQFVLVVDQTFGDAAIEYGGASAASFDAMLAAALAENADLPVVLKVHPEVMAGRKRGHFDLDLLQKNPRIILLADDVHPADLLPLASCVYVVTSQMGFDALLWGIPVRCFGMPFYAGWGLTQDEIPQLDRRCNVDLLQLVYASLIAYPRYIDPESHARCEVEAVLAHLALQRQMRRRLPAQLYAFGFSSWKRPIVAGFCQGSAVQFISKPRQIKQADWPILVWGHKHTDLLAALPNRLIHVEDGFLRSVGLGADLIQPVSWVMDQRGIYFDAGKASDLEHLLQYGEFSAEAVARAKALREQIVALGLTKYNVGRGEWRRPDTTRAVVLVAGQVESDASIRYGAGEIRRNMDLLRAVRAELPEAYILYKPHPDVVAGLRASGVAEGSAKDWCDEIVVDAPMSDLLGKVDAVHVLTSLTGFEALLRGIPVTCWGIPFYAGWKLTSDRIHCDRRSRTRSLDELVAATLLHYPVYRSRVSARFTTPECALQELLAWKNQPVREIPAWRQLKRFVFGLFK